MGVVNNFDIYYDWRVIFIKFVLKTKEDIHF